jgi:hypothetical protein
MPAQSSLFGPLIDATVGRQPLFYCKNHTVMKQPVISYSLSAVRLDVDKHTDWVLQLIALLYNRCCPSSKTYSKGSLVVHDNATCSVSIIVHHSMRANIKFLLKHIWSNVRQSCQTRLWPSACTCPQWLSRLSVLSVHGFRVPSPKEDRRVFLLHAISLPYPSPP